MYQIIHDWLVSLFGNNLTSYSTEIMGVQTTFQEWICSTGTIVILVLLCVALGSMVVYLFKLFANLWRR